MLADEQSIYICIYAVGKIYATAISVIVTANVVTIIDSDNVFVSAMKKVAVIIWKLS